jgi:hypothetical protein
MTLAVQAVNAKLWLGFHRWILAQTGTLNVALEFYVSAFNGIERLAKLSV